MIATDLELVLQRIFMVARQERRQSVAPEDLLWQLLDHKAVARHLEASSVPVLSLKVRLREYLEAVPTFPTSVLDPDTQPTIDFQKTIQKAILRVQSQGRNQVTVVDVLGVLLDPRLGLSVTRLMAEVTAPESLERARTINGQGCNLCGELTTPESWTVVTGRGVLCSDCMAAIAAARRAQ